MTPSRRFGSSAGPRGGIVEPAPTPAPPLVRVTACSLQGGRSRVVRLGQRRGRFVEWAPAALHTASHRVPRVGCEVALAVRRSRRSVLRRSPFGSTSPSPQHRWHAHGNPCSHPAGACARPRPTTRASSRCSPAPCARSRPPSQRGQRDAVGAHQVPGRRPAGARGARPGQGRHRPAPRPSAPSSSSASTASPRSWPRPPPATPRCSRCSPRTPSSPTRPRRSSARC